MTRTRSPLVAALVVLGILVAVPVAGLAAQATDTEAPSTNETAAPADTETVASAGNGSATPPGAQLAGVVGVGEAEIEGVVDDRAFGIRLARAASNDSRADVVADRLGEVENRLSELEADRDELRQARENGSMREGEYRARAAKLAARSESAERAANRSADVAGGFPADLLESKGINATAIRSLAERANELTGPEVAEIARSIAGKNVGGPPAGERGPPGDDGPVPDDAGPGEARPDDAGPGDAGPEDAGRVTEARGEAGPEDPGGEAGTTTGTPDDTDGSDDPDAGGPDDRGDGA